MNDLAELLQDFHRDKLAEYEALMTQMLTAPRFAPEDFDRLRSETLDYITKTLRGGSDEVFFRVKPTCLQEARGWRRGSRGTRAPHVRLRRGPRGA